MKFEFSEPNQQYQYFLEVTDIRELKHVKLSIKYQGAKFPDVIQSQSEFFLNAKEWQSLKESINSLE